MSDFNWDSIKAATHELGQTSEHDHPGSEAAYLALLKFQRDNGKPFAHFESRQPYPDKLTSSDPGYVPSIDG